MSSPVAVRVFGALHIESDKGASILLQNALGGLGRVNFTQTFSFEEGLALLADESFRRQIDLIIMDWTLPGMSGKEALSILRDDVDLQSIPVFILTGSSDPWIVQAALDGSAQFVATKPHDFDGYAAILAKVQQVLDTRAHLVWAPVAD